MSSFRLRILTQGNVIYRSVIVAGHQAGRPASPEDIDAVY
ncbi:hypothetical protein HMPREF1608_00623 [Escherichia coli 908525]|nr:hypothetical protein HMPREF9547_03519 [Escherichia coli MS 175-1]EFJ82894.1 hypothetical protein HMPREF9534_01035 [Escherichia coli MS 69-1]EFK43819.1 hypothetical protein HMPREF9346_04630 [Escherichia coli MS 119-7]EGB86203.1 hypothetical protein HMPREF9542_04372 [Escherichia coli MS 117-3]EIO30476.1 hypothetical protein ECPA40_1588 [Escherichia coli PA40]EIO39485.1 hypothetical protein ECPA39_2916 [Escherichia coli PA39]EIP40578.1 hypothetical protein ECEC4439_2833 [Escherichia coli EC44